LTRPNAAELIAGIERGWHDVRAGRDDPPAENGHAAEGAPQSTDGLADPAPEARDGARPESTP
jgi:hypothetical protein